MNSANPVTAGARNFARVVISKGGAQVVVYRTVYDPTGQAALACLAKVGEACSTLWSVYDSAEEADAAFGNVEPELVESAVQFAMLCAVDNSLWGLN